MDDQIRAFQLHRPAGLLLYCRPELTLYFRRGEGEGFIRSGGSHAKGSNRVGWQVFEGRGLDGCHILRNDMHRGEIGDAEDNEQRFCPDGIIQRLFQMDEQTAWQSLHSFQAQGAHSLGDIAHQGAFKKGAVGPLRPISA